MHWLDARGNAKKIVDPCLHDAAQPVKGRLREGNIDRRVEHVGTAPIFIRCFGGEDVDADLIRGRPFLEHPCHAGLKLDRCVVSHHDAAVIQRHGLLAKQAFGGANLQRVGFPIKDVAKDDLRQLFDEQWRKIDFGPTNDRNIGGLERGILCQKSAESQHGAIVVHDVAVDDGIEILLRHLGEGVLAQPRMQGAFGRTGIILRGDLVTGIIGQHEIRAGNKPSIGIAVKKVPTRGQPEILCHVHSLGLLCRVSAGIDGFLILDHRPDLLLGAGIGLRQAAETLGDAILAKLALDCQQRAGLMLCAQLGHEGNFLSGGGARHLEVGRTKSLDKGHRHLVGQTRDIFLTGIDDADQRREAEGSCAQKAVAEGLLDLAGQCLRRQIGKTESADKRPFAFLGGSRKDVQVGRIKPNDARQLHDMPFTLRPSPNAIPPDRKHSRTRSGSGQPDDHRS